MPQHRYLVFAFAIAALTAVGSSSFVGTPQAQQPAPAVAIVPDDIAGVVRGPNGPEAGVWVIAETRDLPVRYITRRSIAAAMRRRRSSARRRDLAVLAERVAALAVRLRTALRTEFEQAQARTVARLSDAIAPYSRFVRAEESRWRDARATLEQLSARLESLTPRA